jgi:hypothetical protein
MNNAIELLWKLQQLEMGPNAGKASLEPEIKKLREQVPPPIMGHYDRLRVRGKAGVAMVRNGVCSGCHMRLAVGVNADLLRGEDILLCDSCGRYLIGQPEPAPGSEAAPAPAKKVKVVTKRKPKVAVE